MLPLLGVNFELFPRALCLVSLWAENDNIMTYVNSQGFIAEEVHRLVSTLIEHDLKTSSSPLDIRSYTRRRAALRTFIKRMLFTEIYVL